MEELNFDLAPIEIPVTILKKKFILREASGDAACKYRNLQLRSTKMTGSSDNKGLQITSIDGIADAEPLLVSMCLFAVSDEGVVSPKSVSEQFVRTLPSKYVTKLFEKVQEISGLKEELETEEVLNQQILDASSKLDKLKQGKDTNLKN